MRKDSVLESVKQQLTQRLAELRGDIAREQAAEDDARQVRGAHEVQDAGEVATQAALAEVRAPAADMPMREALALEAALHRLAEGNYGICADCHRQIPVARLLAEPACLRCLGCQQACESHATRS
jgi:RNA polymerase-binding transcription factor DksA